MFVFASSKGRVDVVAVSHTNHLFLFTSGMQDECYRELL